MGMRALLRARRLDVNPTGVAARGGAGPRRVSTLPVLLAPALLATAVLATAAPVAAAPLTATPLSLEITFSATGVVTVTLPDGTPVGTASGSPTVIPGGYYTLHLSGPGGCSQLPLFDLQGPGEHLDDDMSGGEVNTETYNVYLAPNSTYTWRLDNVNPPTVYTFVTNGQVLGTPPSASVSSTTSTVASSGGPTSDNVVGTAVVPSVPYRGTLAVSAAASGQLSIRRDGRSVTTVAAGRYTVSVVDRTDGLGLAFESAAGTSVQLSSGSFLGSRSLSVELSAGRWRLVAVPEHGHSVALVVS